MGLPVIPSEPVEPIVGQTFSVGDKVVIRHDNEGYSGKVGEVVAVFPSGRCQVSIGPITILHLPPAWMQHEVLD